MSEMDLLKQEMRELARQVSADFEFNALVCKDLSQRFNHFSQELTRQLQLFSADCSERFQQIEGRTRLQEQRWSSFFSVVDRRLDKMTDQTITRDEFNDIRQRVERLEKTG